MVEEVIMSLRRNLSLAVLAWPLLAAPASLAAATTNTSAGAPVGQTTQFTLSADAEVPGRTLAAGTYSIRILDQLSDRMIVQVNQAGGKKTVFLALPGRIRLSHGRGSDPGQGERYKDSRD